MQPTKFSAIVAAAVAFSLSGCATTTTTTQTVAPGSAAATSDETAAAGGPQRDLTPQEKKVIVDAVAPSLRDPASAKYRWTKFPTIVTEDSVNYCAMVNGKAPFPAYNGDQAYIVEVRLAGGHVSSAVMGLIAGGKDRAIVANMCAKYGLDPNKAK